MVRLTDRLLAGSFILALMAHAYLGSFSRYMADDYTISTMARARGLFGAQVYWYLGWTGRFSFTFVASLLGLIGPATTRFVPALLLIVWIAATAWAISQIHSSSGRTSWTKAVLFAGLVIFATLETAPNLVQSLYWQTGALTYIAPLVLLSLYVGIVIRFIRGTHQGAGFYAAGVLMFVAGGFSDAYVVLQSCGLILAVIAVEIFAPQHLKRIVRTSLLVGLLGSLLALAIVAIAPGNSARQAYFPNHLGLPQILSLTVIYSLRFIAKLILTHPIVLSLLLGLPFLMVLRDKSVGDTPVWNRQLCIRLLLLVPPATFVLVACCSAPSFYGMSVMLPERARILLSLTFVCGTVVWSRAAGEFLLATLRSNMKQTVRTGSTLLLMLMIAVPLVSFISTLRMREQARAYAADWDRQDMELRAARGVNDATVEQIGDFQWRLAKGPSDLHLRTDPAFWINRGTAEYYGLSSVRAKDEDFTQKQRQDLQN
jgi:hypothetical protein